MKIQLFEDKPSLGKAAADNGAAYIRQAITETGETTIIVATGVSQFEMLTELVQAEGVAWDKVTAFHLDEYVGLPLSHPASFRKYLRERFVEKLPTPLKAFHYINGEGDISAELARLKALISPLTVDVAFVGIGENGHLAFNDPPADFETEEPYLVVGLDDACRRQQLGEGWFPDFDSVPTQAISMSIRQIMKSRRIIASVPDARKAEAVKACIEGPVSPYAPASILQQHEATTLYLDSASAALLNK